jgi:hypothetical protein
MLQDPGRHRAAVVEAAELAAAQHELVRRVPNLVRIVGLYVEIGGLRVILRVSRTEVDARGVTADQVDHRHLRMGDHPIPVVAGDVENTLLAPDHALRFRGGATGWR